MLLLSLICEDSKCKGLSAVRVMAFIALFAGCYIAYEYHDVALTSVFVTSAFGAKVAQKHLETRSKVQ